MNEFEEEKVPEELPKEEEKVEEQPAQEAKKDDYVMPLPEDEKNKGNIKELPPNTKAHWSMRIAGGLIDLCLMFMSTIGLFFLIGLTPLANGMKKYQNLMVMVQDNYKVTELVEGSDETYGHKVYENEESYASYSKNLVHAADETGYQYVVVDNETISEEVAKAYAAAVKADADYSTYSFNYRLIEYGLTMLAGFVATAVFLLVIPLTNKRRATVGKLFAGSQLIDSKYQTRAKWYQVMGRYSFQFLIEGALPYLFISGWTAIAIPALLLLISLINKKDGRTLHDLVSRTKVIDKRTYLPLSKQ